MPDRKAAIAADEVMSRSLSDISAAEFLQVLSRPGIDPGSLAILPDKKKYELWVDEGSVNTISVGELIAKIKVEKKKVELEIPDFLLRKLQVEGPFPDPWVFDGHGPQQWRGVGRAGLDRTTLIEEIADRVAEKIRQG